MCPDVRPRMSAIHGGSAQPTSVSRKLRILIASTTVPSSWLLERLIGQLLEADVELIAITENAVIDDASVLLRSIARPNGSHDEQKTAGLEHIRAEAARLSAWSEMLILAPMGANHLAKMLHGVADSLMLDILRSWDVSKKIMLIPGMSCAMWENPMTRKQLSKIRRKWKWITVFTPVLWNYETESEKAGVPHLNELVKKHATAEWDGMEEIMGAVRNQLDLATIGQNVDVDKLSYRPMISPRLTSSDTTPPLPPELWSIILEYTDDWELAQALNVRTTLSIPAQWRQHVAGDVIVSGSHQHRLEWALLHTDTAAAQQILASCSPLPKYLSRLSIQMIMRWALVPFLTHLESSHKGLFWTTFGHSFIPNKASAIFGRVELLEYWRTSPSFLTKEYTDDAMDQASANGFVHVLDWWKNSGLTLKYSEAALEIASGRGHLEVLEWWRRSSKYAPGRNDNDLRKHPLGEQRMTKADAAPIPCLLYLKPGRSISNATQSGHLPVLRWWAHSTIPFSHEDTLLKLASAHGHVHLLDFWLAHRGASKLLFDSSILVAPTKLGHANVLEWWKEQARRGMRVEYKICDVEEALEDARGGAGAEEVRRWWARNGLNLGVGTSEWMKTKVLS